MAGGNNIYFIDEVTEVMRGLICFIQKLEAER